MIPRRAGAGAALAVAVLMLAVPVPSVGAQGGTTLVLEDPAGDVKTELGGQPAAGGEAAYPGVDLTGLAVQETALAFLFTVHVTALQTSNDPGADGVLYLVQFTHNGREFRLAMQMAFRGLNDDAFTSLAYRDAVQDDWSPTWSGYSVIDTAANSLTADVGRDLLADKDGAAPFPGRALEDIHVLAQSILTDGSIVFVEDEGVVPVPLRVTDALPDSAPHPSLPIQHGLAQTGHARLASTTPFRASNGEATTFVYEVTAANIGDEADVFELGATAVPAGYILVLPVPALALDAGEEAEVPVLLTMPFSHQHGALASFILELRSLNDQASVGRLAMGVRFLEVPQPAGHHNTVYLHAGAVPGGGLGSVFGPPGYLNTLEDDPNDSGAKVCDRSFGLPSMAEPGSWHVSWPFYLQPTLAMGLDVDAEKVGTLRVPIATTFPAVQAQLFANLYVEPPTGDDGEESPLIHLAGMAGSAMADLAGGGTATVFEGDLVPAEAAPRLPYEGGSNMVLWLTLLFKGANSLGLADESACILPGGSAVLPLREWHDAVDEVLSALDGPGLQALGPQERLVNPGEAATFPFSIANPLDKDLRFRLEASGANAPWADLPASVLVPAHGTAKALVVVRAPADAAAGERADLILQAYSKEDPAARGLLRFVTIVDTTADHPDDTAAAVDLAKKESPTPGAAGLLAAVALALLVRRTRR